MIRKSQYFQLYNIVVNKDNIMGVNILISNLYYKGEYHYENLHPND